MDSSSIAQAISKPIATSRIGPEDCAQSCESVGERWGSIKQFLNRLTPVFTTAARNASSLSINPYVIHIPSIKTDGTMTQGDLAYGPYNYFGPMYLFQRGSIVIGIQKDPTVSGANTQMILCNTPDDPYNLGTALNNGFPQYTNTLGNYSQVITDSTLPCGGMVVTDQGMSYTSAKVPYYCMLKASVVQNTIGGATINSTDASFPLSRLQVYSAGNIQYASIFRATGDDHQFSYFLGCPPIYVSNT